MLLLQCQLLNSLSAHVTVYTCVCVCVFSHGLGAVAVCKFVQILKGDTCVFISVYQEVYLYMYVWLQAGPPDHTHLKVPPPSHPHFTHSSALVLIWSCRQLD